MKKTILFFIFLYIFISCQSIKDDTPSFQFSTFNRFTIFFDASRPKSLQKPVEYQDRALLLLPENYKKEIKTKMVIYCHSGGGYVSTTNSEAQNSDYVRFFVSLGYAVLDVNGIPDQIVNDLKIDVGRTVGNFIALNEYLAAYKYVINHYNIDIDNVFLFANSNGGLVSCNLVNLTDIKFKAQSAICPLLSIKDNAWNISNGHVSGGEFLNYQNRANIIRLYNMKNIATYQELIDAEYEEDKVAEYEPIKFLIDNSLKYEIPFKIFQTKDDPTVDYNIAKNFCENNQINDGNVTLRTFEKGGHTNEPNNLVVGEYRFNEKSYKLTSTVLEVAKYFEQNGGEKVIY